MTEQRVQKLNTTKNHIYYDYLLYLCKVSKNLYNQALFIQRQAFFDSSYYMNYFELDKLTKITSSLLYKNFHLLPSMVAQQTLRVLDKNWKAYFESIKDYKKNPSNYTGRPKPPKYLDKDSYFNLHITDQSIHYENDIIRISCFSKLFKEQLKLNVKLSKIKGIQKINQIRILPRNNKLIVEIIYTKEFNSEKYQGSKCIGIDIGVDNLLTISGDIASPIIVNGKGLKSINQFYNKRKAEMQSELMLKNKKHWSKNLQRLTDKRNNKIEDVMHKTSRWLITFCLENGISTIVIGKNKNWKQKCNLGKKNNQNFIQIPFTILEKQIDYKARELGLNVIWQEESYTSKASFFDNDKIPIFNAKKDEDEGNSKHQFSGKRIKRGLYRTKDGFLVNADVNGSLNILRKSKVACDTLEKIKSASRGLVANPVKIVIF